MRKIFRSLLKFILRKISKGCLGAWLLCAKKLLIHAEYALQNIVAYNFLRTLSMRFNIVKNQESNFIKPLIKIATT
jgi:hypothetical protein